MVRALAGDSTITSLLIRGPRRDGSEASIVLGCSRWVRFLLAGGGLCHVKVARPAQRPSRGPYSRTANLARSELEEPVGDEVPNDSRRYPVRTQGLGERGQDLGHGQLAVAGADEGRLGRVDLPGAS